MQYSQERPNLPRPCELSSPSGHTREAPYIEIHLWMVHPEKQGTLIPNHTPPLRKSRRETSLLEVRLFVSLNLKHVQLFPQGPMRLYSTPALRQKCLESLFLWKQPVPTVP